MKTISSAGSAGLGQTGAPFVETVPPRSVGFYCLKNGLSAHLISTLAEKRLHRRQVVLSNCWLPPEQESVVFGEVRQSAFDAKYRTVSWAYRWEKVWLWLAAVQAPVYLYHTHSYDVQLHRLMGRSFPPCRHVVIEHGTVEWFRYIEGCKRGVVDPNIHYLLSFHEEIVRYLARNGIEPTLSSSPFPFRTTPRNGAAPDCQGRTLFAIQPLVDDGVIDETDCRQVMARFLARRPEKHYVVKSHPRCCERTVQIVSQALRQAGCVHELLSASDGIIETQFPKYRCEEICSFYSTATMLTAKLHDVPFDTAIPELLEYATIRMPVQRELIALIAELFQLIP